MNVKLTKTEKLTLISCLNERRSNYIKVLAEIKDEPSERLMINGYKRRIHVIDDLLNKLGFERFPDRKKKSITFTPSPEDLENDS